MTLVAGLLGGTAENAQALRASAANSSLSSVAFLPVTDGNGVAAIADPETTWLQGPSPNAKSRSDWREDFGASATDSTVPPGWSTERVRRGDNAGAIFQRLNIAKDLEAVLASDTAANALKDLHPRDEILYQRSADGALAALSYRFDETKVLSLKKEAGAWTASVIETPVETRIAVATGKIESSLFAAADRAGLSDGMTLELAKIFAYDIDFALDLREGDKFAVVYEQIFRDGKKIRDGNILAAEFGSEGKVYRAVSYTDAQGRTAFYSPNGKGLRKSFIRTPVDFTRISSYFSLQRFHPILNRLRAHKGVDYAAPKGTPVKATGDGKVVFAGRKGGYGNVIILQHGQHYSTLYGHLSGFAKGISEGKTVEVGQTIAFVGMTGLATGPHLHYEFHVDGVYRNPLTVSLPNISPLGDKAQLADFKRKTQPLMARLLAADKQTVASNSQ